MEIILPTIIAISFAYNYLWRKKSPTIFIHRHGYRQDFYDEKYNTTTWVSSPRFRENPSDPPLYDPNEPKIAEHAALIPHTVKWIYTSPMTRCIQTSIILARKINELRSLSYNTSPINIMVIYELAEYGGIIDAELMPASLARRYPNITLPAVDPRRIPNESYLESYNNFKSILDNIADKGEPAIVMAHCGHLYMGITYLVGAVPFLYEGICGNNKTGMMAICDGDRYELVL
jgi:broad specificity phosphatase PhoE